jgi:cytochrome P450
LLRSTLAFGRNPIQFFVDSYQRYGPAFRINAFDFDMTVMIGPRAHRAMFVEHGDKLSARKGYAVLLPLLDDALPVSDGQHHTKQKRLIQPAFHTKRIESYLETMWDAASRQLATWTDGAVVDVYEAARQMTLDAVLRALTGTDLQTQHPEFAHVLSHTFDYVTKPNVQKWVKLDLPFTKFGQNRRARAQLDTLMLGMIQDRRETGAAGNDVLSWLISTRDEAGNQMSDQSIRDQLLFLIYAGHDTATCTIAWALHLLATHAPEMRLITDEARAQTVADLSSLTTLRSLVQLEMVIDETLRLYPPSWIGLRGVTESFEFEGMTIRAGTNVMYSSGASHRLPEIFDDPLAFRPARFAPAQKAQLPPFAYVPFGGGAHMCIGMPFAMAELKLMLARILREWQFEPINNKPIPLHYNPTLAPKYGIQLRVRRR